MCGESKEKLRAMVYFLLRCVGERSESQCRQEQMMVLGWEEGLECEVYVDGINLEHVSEFKYLRCVLNESGTDEAECSRKMPSWRRVAGAIRSLVNAMNLQLECTRVLQET